MDNGQWTISQCPREDDWRTCIVHRTFPILHSLRSAERSAAQWIMDNGQSPNVPGKMTGGRALSIVHFPFSIRSAARSVVPGRVELPTSTLSVWRSNQLSYRTGVSGGDAGTMPARAGGDLSVTFLSYSDYRQDRQTAKQSLAAFAILFHSVNCLKANGVAPERRCSSRTFRYGYLVTT